MGIIDGTRYTLSCKKCGSNETSTVLDKGSRWSGSAWRSGATFSKFETSWSGGGEREPDLRSATCVSCGTPASVNRT